MDQVWNSAFVLKRGKDCEQLNLSASVFCHLQLSVKMYGIKWRTVCASIVFTFSWRKWVDPEEQFGPPNLNYPHLSKSKLHFILYELFEAELPHLTKQRWHFPASSMICCLNAVFGSSVVVGSWKNQRLLSSLSGLKSFFIYVSTSHTLSLSLSLSPSLWQTETGLKTLGHINDNKEDFWKVWGLAARSALLCLWVSVSSRFRFSKASFH